MVLFICVPNWCFWTVVLEKTLESPLDCKEIQPVHPKGDQSLVFGHWKGRCWSWNSNTLATWWEELTYWKRPWCWERLRAGGKGDDRGWDGWMTSSTQWTWVWMDSGSWWWTGRPGMLRFLGSQRVGHDWVTELNWTELGGFACSTHPRRCYLGGFLQTVALGHSASDPNFLVTSLVLTVLSRQLLSKAGTQALFHFLNWNKPL